MDGKIEIDGSVYLWTVSDGVLTDTSPDGRQKRIQTGKTYYEFPSCEHRNSPDVIQRELMEHHSR